VERLLEDALIELPVVPSDAFRGTGRAMMAASVGGLGRHVDPVALQQRALTSQHLPPPAVEAARR
jgi:hypothetical protein